MKLFKFKVSDLTLDPENARKHNDKSIAAIVQSLKTFGQQKPIVVRIDGDIKTVAAGNGTTMAAMQIGLKTLYGIATDLNGQELAAYSLADNRTAELSEWDNDKLLEILGSLEGQQELLDACGFSDAEMQEIAAVVEVTEAADPADNPYSRKIEAPIYKPTGDCPQISELVDSAKAEELVAEVRAAGLPEEVEQFLVAAAVRHTVFNFERIAEFYCHADAKTQSLMERSACVIIDFDKAIENGYTALSQGLSELYAKEYDGND